MGRWWLLRAGALGIGLSMSQPALAQESLERLCALWLHEHRIELQDLELEVDLNATRLVVDEEIFDLLDELWRNDLVEGLVYLAVKHRRDSSLITLESSRRQVDRQRSRLAQFELACSSERDENAEDALEAARQNYREADCAIRSLQVDQFETDLVYQREVLQSALDLRQVDVASRQQVLFAERDVSLSTKQLELAQQRHAQCEPDL